VKFTIQTCTHNDCRQWQTLFELCVNSTNTICLIRCFSLMGIRNLHKQWKSISIVYDMILIPSTSLDVGSNFELLADITLTMADNSENCEQYLSMTDSTKRLASTPTQLLLLTHSNLVFVIVNLWLHRLALKVWMQSICHTLITGKYQKNDKDDRCCVNI